ncbi:MAG: M15 family metallopeptidase [Clostridia bacterium]|nr:M15 family metallopeptidase [Clostridia bacterium]
MKRLLPLILSLMLFGCSSPASEQAGLDTVEPTTVPTATATAEVLELSFSATETPPPLAITPSPSPTPTPVPTATPNPLEGLNAVYHGTDDRFYHVDLSDEVRERITGLSYPKSGAKIGYDELRYVHIMHVDFDGITHEGELIVNEKLADEVMEIFYQLFIANYALTSVRLVDDFGEAADDTLSMEANNTSAFCYRTTSSGNLSRHSYGAAIDINPMMNPYVKSNGSYSPKNSTDYLDRSTIRPGMIDENDLCYQLFTSYGWEWGGHFRTEKDYQHFSKDIT